jgi:hypothetical protein
MIRLLAPLRGNFRWISQLAKAIKSCLYQIMWIMRSKAFRQNIVDTGNFQYCSNSASGNQPGSFGRGF